MKYLLIFLLIFQSAFAFATDDVDSVYLETGKPAPYTGYLLTPEAANQVKLHILNEMVMNRRISNQNAMMEDYEHRINNYETQTAQLEDRLEKTDTGFFQKAAFFFLGSIVTGLVSYGVVKTLR